MWCRAGFIKALQENARYDNLLRRPRRKASISVGTENDNQKAPHWHNNAH
jgi:hypothetical protein